MGMGIGAGAHSRMFVNNERYKFNNPKNPFKWLENQLKTPSEDFLNTKDDVQKLSHAEQFQEKALMGLRLSEGIEITAREIDPAEGVPIGGEVWSVAEVFGLQLSQVDILRGLLLVTDSFLSILQGKW